MSIAGRQAERKTKDQELDDLIRDLANKCKLDCWTAFVEELQVPEEIAPAVITGRRELIALAQARPLTKEECAALYRVVGALIETNTALRDHASQLATFVRNWADAFKALKSVGERIERFALFRRSDDELEDDEAA